MRWIDREVDGDRWAGSFEVDQVGHWAYEVGAWTDHFATWHDEVARKRAAAAARTSPARSPKERCCCARPPAARPMPTLVGATPTRAPNVGERTPLRRTDAERSPRR